MPGIMSEGSASSPRAATPATGLSGSSWVSCAAVTAGRAGSRRRRSCRWRPACSAPSSPICRDQQRLDNSNIGAALEQVGREAVAQRVQRHGLLDPGRVGRLVKQTAQLAGGHRLAAPVAGKQPAFGHRCSGIVTRWAGLPPLAQQTERLRRQHTLRSLRRLDCSTRMIFCALSICLTLSLTTSLARRPQP